MNDLTFVHLSDLHISNPNVTDEHLFSDTTQTFEHVKSLIVTLEPKPEFIVVSGDLTNRGDRESYLELRRLLADMNVPLLLALGNHDDREAFYEVVLEQPERGDAPYDYARDFDGLRVIVLDSSAANQVYGSLEPEQFTWLEVELAANPETPKLVVIHHPPAPMHLPIFDQIWNYAVAKNAIT